MGYITYHHADCMTNILADVQAPGPRWEGARIYYACSSCAYPLHIQESPDTPPVKESDLLANYFNPELGYGWEKLYAEMVFQAYAEDEGLQARIGRYFSVYGPNGWYKDEEITPEGQSKVSELSDCAAATGILTCAMLKMSRTAKKRPERLHIISESRSLLGV